MIAFQCDDTLLKKKGMIVSLLLVIASYTDVAFALSPILSVSAASIIEHIPFNMTCVTATAMSYWFRNNVTDTYIAIGVSNQACASQGLSMSMYGFFCEKNAVNENIFTLTFKNVTINQQSDTWRCASDVDGSDSNTITINISVPVDHVRIGTNEMSTITLNETGSKALNCTTSPSRPMANIYWYVIAHDLCDGKNIQIDDHTTYTRSDDGLQSTTSTIELTLNRTYNGCILVCKAENIRNEAVYHNVSLNITYPTNKPIIQCTHNNTYKVIRNHPAALTCTVDGGNPAGALQWGCTGSITEQHGTRNNDIVSKSITWNATQTTFCTCNSMNIAGTSTESVTTSILYPPVISQMENKTIIEGNTTVLQCGQVEANPPVNIIRWTYGSYNVTNATLAISNVSRRAVKVYTCTAINTMDPSCQEVEYGSTSRSIHIEVLYPPSVNISKGTLLEVIEGAHVKYTCPVVHGNPPNTKIKWRRSNDTETWSTAELLIPNVSRYDDSLYTCYASNVMKDSNGLTKIGNVSADIRLIVQFKTNVTYFYIRSYGPNTSVVVMENTSIVFECRLQSNPTADVKIYESVSIVNSSNANELLYNTHALCVGMPVYYRCHGNNFLNNEPSSREVQVFVTCKPRAELNADVHFIVTSAINQNVTLSYTALAYPHPLFEWYINGSSITTRDSRVYISSTELQTNLTIPNVEESDFGEYTLTVSNDIGSINESFQLKPDGVPEVPTDLTQDESKTTDLVIALYWKSGFNNGSKQNFTVMYSKHTEDNLQSATVQDTGPTGTTIHYTITGLSSDTSYDIVLFAVNAKGPSKTNVTLTCRTTLKMEDTGHASIIGAAVGSVAGLLLIGVVIAGVVIFRKRMTKKPSDEQEASASLYANVEKDNKSVIKHELNSLVIPTDRGIYENAELGKTKKQSHKPIGGGSSKSGEYVNFSKKKLAEIRMTKQVDLSMQPISSDVKATAQRSTYSEGPPSIPSTNEFAGVLCKVDDDDGHEGRNAHQQDENIYSNSSERIERIENVFVHELFAFVAGKSVESFATEFNILPKGLTMPCTVAVKPENIKLNRYNGIFPYDHSRVTIHDDPDFFINACYMDGYKKEKCYIASLGPTADTSSGFKTFWKMVWHEQSDVIVMVTNLREITGMKCEQYWPNVGSSKVFGEVTVTSRNVEEYAEYTVRTFNVSQANHNRTVTQLHFTAWPDKGVPDDLTSLLEFRQRMMSTPSPEPGPVIVHCSAGIGRTGTLIALDRLIAEGKATNSINVSTCVSSMRQQRVSMVQTQEQYVYIYKACVYALAFECECISAESFHDILYATTDAQFSELFTRMKAMVDNESDDEKKAVQNNKQDKSNRPSADIAGDKYRVRLYVDKDSNDSDYTNAVYVNSFKTKNKFIAAQTPLKNFVQDFICMIFQEQCVCVMDMDGNMPSKLDVGVYIPPVNQSFTFGNFTISCEKLDSNPKYTVNKLKIDNTGKYYKGKWTSYHFSYHDWKHGKDTPSDSSNLVEFVKEVDDYATQFGEKGSHVLVHCLDASKRSGLLCFVACLLEKIQCERQVNIGNTLRQVRTRRKTTIKNANQLKFCYETVDAFVEMSKAQ